MSCTTQTKKANVTLEAARVYWGKGECRTITFAADSADDQSGSYFDLNKINPDGTETKYYVLLDSGAASDPSPAGKTKITVSYTTGDTAVTIAAAAVSAIDAIDGFFVTNNADGSIEVENWYPGVVTVESAASAGDVTVVQNTEGFGGNLGPTSEGIELTTNTESVQITSNQTGAIVIDEIVTGQAIELSASFLEASASFWSTVVGQVTGSDLTPSGGTKVTGFGEAKLYQSLSDLGGRLILHPIRLADTDRSSDFVFWKCAPIPESINFDGTAPQTMSVTFRAYLDSSKDTKINQAVRGDWTQDLDA